MSLPIDLFELFWKNSTQKKTISIITNFQLSLKNAQILFTPIQTFKFHAWNLNCLRNTKQDDLNLITIEARARQWL
jgi:hypothetical protein